MKMLGVLLLVMFAALYFWLGPGVARFFMSRVEVTTAGERAAAKRQEAAEATVDAFVELAGQLDDDTPEGKKPVVSVEGGPWPELEAARPTFLAQTTALVEERVDGFDHRVNARHRVDFALSEGVTLHAYASWKEKGQLEPLFFLVLTRVAEDWRWLKQHQAQLVLGTNPTELECRLETAVSGNGGVREIAWLTLPPEIVATWARGQRVQLRLGRDEWVLDVQQQSAVPLLFKRWIAQGGNARPYRELLPPGFLEASR